MLALIALILQAQEPEYAKWFDDTKVHTIHVIAGTEDWAQIVQKPSDWVKGDVEIDGELVAGVGIRQKGNSSTRVRSDKKPLKIDFTEFDKKKRFHGLRMLVLNNGFRDPSLLREKLAYDLLRAAGCPASRAAHARVFVTAAGKLEKAYLGLYTMVEHVDEAFLDERFGGHEGNLYKIEGREVGMRDLFGQVEERWIADEKAVELKTNKKANDRSRLVAFVKAVVEGKDDLAKWLDVESFLKALAVNAAMVNLDSFAGTGHNYYLYDDPRSGRFVLIPWDLNMAFGNFQMGPAADHLEWDIFLPWAGWRKALIERILAVPEHRTRYLEILKGLGEREFSTKAMAERIEALHTLTFDASKEDAKKENPTATLVKSISEDVQIAGGPVSATAFGLKSFVERRAASIRSQLEGKSKGKALRGRAPGEGRRPEGPPRGNPMKEWDADGDGKLSRQEWRGPAGEFDRLDRNGDGYVEAKELRRP